MKHIFSGLFEIFGWRKLGEGNVFWKEINCENIPDFHRVGEVTFVTAIMFERGTNVPPDFAMLAKSGATFSSNMSYNFGAWGCHGAAIKVVVAKKRGMSRQRRMNARRPK
jgi:hypothetical protein